MQKNFIKIDSSLIKEGMRFSAPVFFDDGENMFLVEGKAAKAYHGCHQYQGRTDSDC